MRRRVRFQSGLTLMELLVAMAIAALLVAPLGAAVLAALAAQPVADDANDVSQQARFAMQRMEAAVRSTAPHTLAAKAAATTADWLGTVTFCLNAAAQLIETTPADTTCAGTRVIADKVVLFGVQSYNAGAGAAAVIETTLSLTGPTGQTASLVSRVRLGGGML